MRLTVCGLSLLTVTVSLIGGTVVSTSQPAKAGLWDKFRETVAPSPPKPGPPPGSQTVVKNAGGFYRVWRESEVYSTYGSWNYGWKFCHVKDEAQMNRYGGFQRVETISTLTQLKNGKDDGGGKPFQRQFSGMCKD